MMKELESIKAELTKVFPNMAWKYDPAEIETGSSWLDLETNKQWLTIAWQPHQGFGLYLGAPDAYGSGPDEVYRNRDVLIKRVLMILRDHKAEIKIKEIRELLGITQQELADLTGQQQSSISKLENREDVFMKTMVKVIRALGGEIEIKAHFNECDISLSLPKEQTLNNL